MAYMKVRNFKVLRDVAVHQWREVIFEQTSGAFRCTAFSQAATLKENRRFSLEDSSCCPAQTKGRALLFMVYVELLCMLSCNVAD